MRFFLMLATAVMVASPAAAATRNFGITGFTKIRVDGPYKVGVATGVAPFARATGSAAALDRIAIEMHGDTLVVHTNSNSWGGYPGTDAGRVEINVGTHDLTNAWLTGSGSLAIDRVKGLSFDLSLQGSGAGEISEVNADKINVSLAGTASAKLIGQTLKLTALLRGISTLDAARLTAHDAAISADGAATVNASATNSVTVDAWGPATVRLAGRPSCTLRVNGSTSVSGCR
jgi:hypothetical protein